MIGSGYTPLFFMNYIPQFLFNEDIVTIYRNISNVNIRYFNKAVLI